MIIPRRYEFAIFAFFMSLMMSFLMSGVITLVNLGWVDDFLSRWMHAFGSAFVVAFPIALFVVPTVRKIVHRLVVPEEGHR